MHSAPPYVAKPDLVDAIGNCNIPRLKKFVELCIQSRPLFAETVAEKLQQFLDKPNGNVVKLLELVREDLVLVLGSKEGSRSVEGCVGYVMAILQSGKALIGADEAQSRLFGDFNTKNWAYLINDQRTRLSGNPKRPRVKAGGIQRDVFVPLSCKDPRPSFLMLLRTYTPLGDNLYYIGENAARATFACTTFLPDPSEDFLLYLVLFGSVAFPGLYVSNNEQRSHRVTFASLSYEVFKSNKKVPLSVNDIGPEYKYHEAVVLAAFYAACNSGRLSGCSLGELVTRYIAELVTATQPYPQLKTVRKLPWMDRFKVKFALPYNATLPNNVLQLLGATRLTRPPNEQRADGASISLDKSGNVLFDILLEAKLTLDSIYVEGHVDKAPRCQDSNARLSFIVVNKDPDNGFKLDPSKIKMVDRNKKHGKSETLNARVFLVDVNKELRVVLEPLDGKPRDEPSDRLIFIICLAGLNRKLNK